MNISYKGRGSLKKGGGGGPDQVKFLAATFNRSSSMNGLVSPSEKIILL